jgi:hypothetical protein
LGAARELQNQPVLGNALRPHADVGEHVRREQDAVIAVLKSSEGTWIGHPASLGQKSILVMQLLSSYLASRRTKP